MQIPSDCSCLLVLYESAITATQVTTALLLRRATTQNFPFIVNA